MGQATWPEGVGPHECVWVDDDSRPWLVRASFGRVDDRMEVIGMEVRSYREAEEDRLAAVLPEKSDGATALNSTLWREVGPLVRILRHRYVNVLEDAGLLGRAMNQRAAEAWRAPRDTVGVRHQDLADVYLAAEADGENPIQAVQERFFIEYSTARQRIRRARLAGYLPPAKTGRAPTP